ncbi:hypothetical protein C8R48DRAFT_673809 [Suillus tomentosus]|nr:hypothetical protein C8R48DRAFT_673809 [Suillus tomentosus]
MDVSYDLRWDSEPEAGSVDLEASYDLGWDSAPNGGDYDLGWDSAPDGNDVPSGEVPQESVGVDLEASYGLGWEAPAVDALDSRRAMMASSYSTIDVDNEYDLGWDVVSEDQSCNPIDIDKVYDLGWNDTATVDHMEDRHVQSDLIPLSSSSNSVGDEDSDASAEAAMAHALQRLNAVGHSDDDEQMHCIVQTAVDNLGRSYAPSRVRRANSWLFGAYSEARNWVTEVGEDILSITRLLHLYNGIMDPLEILVKDLEKLESTQ